MKIRVTVLEEFSEDDRVKGLESRPIGAFAPAKLSPPLGIMSFLILPIDMAAGESIELVRHYSPADANILSLPFNEPKPGQILGWVDPE